jgi:hypothetical protein
MSLSVRIPARFPRSVRIVLPVFILLTALQGLGFGVLGTGRAGLLVSQSAQLVVNLVALVCIGCAYKRARAVARTFWLLLGCAFLCWLIANAAWIYATYLGVFLVPESIFNFLYRLYGAPLLMALFLKEDDDTNGSWSLRLLEFLQIGIVALLVYLGEFYLAMKGMLPRDALLLSLLSISSTENVLLLLLTAVRYRFARAFFSLTGINRYKDKCLQIRYLWQLFAYTGS